MASKKPALSKAAIARIKGYEAKSNEQESRKELKRRDNRIALGAGILALALAFGAQLGYSAAFGPTPAPSSSNASPKVPAPSLAENRAWTGSMKLNGSELEFSLDGKKAPQAVANFVSLSKIGFYSDISCHRITTEGLFVLQCGDPKGDGSGDPGYKFGPIENAPADNFYPAGTIAMARQGGNAATQGSQFFIVYEDTTLGSDAAGGYTVFGKVTQGLDVVRALAAKGTADGSGDGKPKSEITLSAVSVR
jgi:peptidyl-prolyl cis-trans isomerase B (cyclophilin B)